MKHVLHTTGLTKSQVSMSCTGMWCIVLTIKAVNDNCSFFSSWEFQDKGQGCSPNAPCYLSVQQKNLYLHMNLIPQQNQQLTIVLMKFWSQHVYN